MHLHGSASLSFIYCDLSLSLSFSFFISHQTKNNEVHTSCWYKIIIEVDKTQCIDLTVHMHMSNLSNRKATNSFTNTILFLLVFLPLFISASVSNAAVWMSSHRVQANLFSSTHTHTHSHIGMCRRVHTSAALRRSNPISALTTFCKEWGKLISEEKIRENVRQENVYGRRRTK